MPCRLHKLKNGYNSGKLASDLSQEPCHNDHFCIVKPDKHISISSANAFAGWCVDSYTVFILQLITGVFVADVNVLL